jgi:hypothetical protein
LKTAERFIVADFFLLNDAYDKSGPDIYPDLTAQLTDALDCPQKGCPRFNRMILITDEINNFYGAYEASHLTRLQGERY